jgi:hypothetical protein
MSKVIHIGDVSIPLENYATSGNAVLGIKESGKTVLSKGISEQLIEYGVMPIIFDAIGVWRHMKTAGDGPNGKGFKVVVAGGKEPDLPLTPTSAAEIVRAAMRENIPLVIDLYDKKLSKADWRRIVQSCFTTMLYENEVVRHIFLEEAPEYVPQKVMDGETFAAVEKLVRMGGNASLGITLISQRAQEVNKSVLDLCENVILMRQRGTHAIDSLEKFMDRMAPEQSRAITKKMPSMTAGEAYIFTGTSDQAEHTRAPMCRSFHPNRRKPVAVDVAKRTVVTSDFVSRLSADLTKVIEENKANDPKLLKARIVELEKMLNGRTLVTGAKHTDSDIVTARQTGERSGYERGWREGAAHERESMVAPLAAVTNATAAIARAAKDLDIAVNEAHRQNDPRMTSPPPAIPKTAAAAQNPRRIPHPSPPRAAPATRNGAGPSGGGSQKGNRLLTQQQAFGGSLPPGERATLGACIQYPDGLERSQLTVITGYKRSSRDAYIQRLASKGYVAIAGDKILATVEGVAALPDFEPLPRGQDLIDFWMNKLPEGEKKVLAYLIEANGEAVDRAEIDEATGYQRSSRDAYLQRLRAKQLVVDEGRGHVKASAELFA